MMASPDSQPIPLIRVTETNSTNSYLHTLCTESKTEELTTVMADFQTSGRGQRGNSWESAPYKNLLFSFVLYPDFLEVRRQFLLSQVVSLAIKEELDIYINKVSIKWPNDIYWEEKKICGILIENDLTGRTISRSIVGAGLNVNQTEFHSPAPNPVALHQITGLQYDTTEILHNIMLRVQSYYSRLQREDTTLITSRYEDSLFRREGMHRYKDANGEFRARIIGVEPDGRLLLEDETRTQRGYMFKEVEYLLK